MAGLADLAKFGSDGVSTSNIAQILNQPNADDERASSLSSIAGGFTPNSPISAILKGVVGGVALTKKGQAQTQREIDNQKLRELAQYETEVKAHQAIVENMAASHAEGLQTGAQLAQAVEQAQLGDESGIKNWLAASPATQQMLKDRIGVPVESAKVTNINGVDMIQAYGRDAQGNLVMDPSPVPVDAYLKAYAPEAYTARSAQRLEQTAAQLKNDNLTADLHTEQARAKAISQPEAAGGPAASTQPSAPPKPMPASVAKLQNDELNAIGTFSGVNADVDTLISQIDSGKLDTSLLSRGEAWLKNNTNSSDEGSRNLATLDSNLNKLRNAVLLLNKGVQTEGDAQRAMDEIINSKNDTALVRKRLEDLKIINQRAVDLRKASIDTVRQDYNHPAMDYSKFENQPSSVTNAPETKTIKGKTYTKNNGQWYEQ